MYINCSLWEGVGGCWFSISSSQVFMDYYIYLGQADSNSVFERLLIKLVLHSLIPDLLLLRFSVLNASL